MREAFLSLQIAQTRLERSQAGDPSCPPPQNRSTKPCSGCPMQPQPFAVTPARLGSSSNLHTALSDLSAARGKLETAKDFLAVIWVYRMAHRLSKLSGILAQGRAMIFFFLLLYNVIGLNRRIMYKPQ